MAEQLCSCKYELPFLEKENDSECETNSPEDSARSHGYYTWARIKLSPNQGISNVYPAKFLELL